DTPEDVIRLVVAGLDSLEIEDRETAEPGERGGEADVDDRVHRRGEDRDRERQSAEDLIERDVGRLDRVRAGRERDVLEAVRRPDRVDLRAEGTTSGGGDWARALDHGSSSLDRSPDSTVPR